MLLLRMLLRAVRIEAAVSTLGSNTKVKGLSMRPINSPRAAVWSLVLIVSLGLFADIGPISHASGPSDVREYVQKARAAYKEKNYPAMIDNLKKALELRPNYWLYTYNMAVGYTLNGNKSEAINWLNR